MKKFIRNYAPNNAPAILVPKAGHTRKGPRGIVSRSSKGIESVRQLLAKRYNGVKKSISRHS